MSTASSHFISLAVLKAKADARQKLRDALMDLIEPTRQEPGNLDYVLFEDRENPGTFYMREAFTSKAALDAHLETQHFKRFAEQMTALLDEPLRLIVLDQISS